MENSTTSSAPVASPNPSSAMALSLAGCSQEGTPTTSETPAPTGTSQPEQTAAAAQNGVIASITPRGTGQRHREVE